MRILGLNTGRDATLKVPPSLLLRDRVSAAVTQSAPNLPAKNGGDQTVTEIMPPFGTNPPSRPVTSGDGALNDRLITNDPRELWYLSLPSKLTPKQVLQILRSALGGDNWQQWQLHRLMQDSWPMYRKCTHELFEPVSNAQYTVHPYCPTGDEPSDEAQKKADLVRRAMNNFDPNQYTDEKGWSGFVYTACDAVCNGISTNELIWWPVQDYGFGPERLPRAVAWTHPRHYTFTNDGQIALYDRDYNRLLFPLAGSPSMAAPDHRKFICAQFMSGAGSALGAGFMRPLAWYWASVVFNREWMMKTAQNYGSPFLDVTYVPGSSAADLAALDAEMASGLANRFIRHVEGTTLTVTPAGTLGTDNPQRHLAEMADQACAFLLLGQEGTTKTQPGQMGGKDDSKEKTKRERVEGVANWMGTDVLNNFVKAVLYANYGVNPTALVNRPTIMPDFTAATDPMAQAQRDQVFIQADVPLLAEEFYRSNNLTLPEEGDLVLKGGVLGYLAAPQEDVGAPPPPPVMGGGFDENGNPVPALGDPAAGDPAAEDDDDAPVNSKQLVPHFNVEKVLAKATKQELEELLPLVEAAERAPHRNGEFTLLAQHLTKIKNRK